MTYLKTALTGIALLASTAVAPVRSQEINPQGWPVPDVKTAKFYYEVQEDVLGEIPGAETTLGVYKAKDGTYFNTATYDGVLYSFSIDTDGKPPMEYFITDMNKDGIFETRYKMDPDGKLKVPSPYWIVKSGKLVDN